MAQEKLLDVVDLSITTNVAGQVRSVLSGVTFDMGPREALGIIGRSGSGKSVLAKALIGWVDLPLRVTSGRVGFAGTDLLRADRKTLHSLRGKRISYVGSDPTTIFDPTVSIGDQIAEKLRAVRPEIGKREAMDRVLELFELVRIPEARMRMGELPSKFSGGMIQRAAIVDAVISDAELLIADNVTQSLDVTVAAQIIRLFQDLRHRLDTSILFISSSLPVIREFADHLLVLEEGQVVERSTPQSLIESPATPYSKNLVSQIPRIWDVAAPFPEGVNRTADVVFSVRDARRTYHVHKKGTLFQSVAVQAVRGVSFDVKRGESLAIVGESGCGKSTLMRLLTWLELPDAGQISFAGANLLQMTSKQRFDLRSQLQLVLQDPYGSIPAHWTVGRTISEALLLHSKMHTTQRRQAVLSIMKEVGLDARLYEKLPTGLSAGQRQRINIARALVLEPSVLLLDETLSALDQTEQGKLIDLLKQIQLTHGITYLFISHDLAMVRRVCSRVAVMYLGRIVEIGANEQLFFKPQHPYTRALLSAAPTLEPSPYARDVYLVEGEPPSPVRLPPGCAFANRCPMKQSLCLREDPPDRTMDNGVTVACHYASVVIMPKFIETNHLKETERVG